MAADWVRAAALAKEVAMVALAREMAAAARVVAARAVMAREMTAAGS